MWRLKRKKKIQVHTQTGGPAGCGSRAELEEVEAGREGKEVKGREGGFGG